MKTPTARGGGRRSRAERRCGGRAQRPRCPTRLSPSPVRQAAPDTAQHTRCLVGQRAADDSGRRWERDQLPSPWSWHCSYHKGQRRPDCRLSLPLTGRPRPLPSAAEAAPARPPGGLTWTAPRSAAGWRSAQPRLPGPVRPAGVPELWANARRAQNVNVRTVAPWGASVPSPCCPTIYPARNGPHPGCSACAGQSSGWRGSAPEPGTVTCHRRQRPPPPPATTAQESLGRNTRTRSGHFQNSAKVHSTAMFKEHRVLESEPAPGDSGRGAQGAGWSWVSV